MYVSGFLNLIFFEKKNAKIDFCRATAEIFEMAVNVSYIYLTLKCHKSFCNDLKCCFVTPYINNILSFFPIFLISFQN